MTQGRPQRGSVHSLKSVRVDAGRRPCHGPDMPRNPKRPRDANQRAFQIVQETTGLVSRPDPDEGKDPAAVAMGRKGGEARAKKMGETQRSEIASKAARVRWGKAD